MSLKLLSLLILFDISFSSLEIPSIEIGYLLFCQYLNFCLFLPYSSINNKLKFNTFSWNNLVYDYVKWLYQIDIAPIKFECFRYKKHFSIIYILKI